MQRLVLLQAVKSLYFPVKGNWTALVPGATPVPLAHCSKWCAICFSLGSASWSML